MSTKTEITVKCSFCGGESVQTQLMSTSSFGLPDLDFRPAPPARYTMDCRIQECPHCGYVAQSIDSEAANLEKILHSDEYKNASNREFKSSLAVRFYKHYMLMLCGDDVFHAAEAALCAAWVCDDCGDEENARYCRLLAVAQLEDIISFSKNKLNYKLQLADVLRRAGQFTRLAETFSVADFEDEKSKRIIEFQLKKAALEDVGRYTMFDVDMM